MAWTTPRTWVAGELVTAALFNTHLRDNLNFLYATGAGGFFFCRSSTPPTAGQTRYYGVWESATETDISIPIPVAGTLRNLSAAASVAPGAAQTFTYTARKNAADTSLTCTISGAAATSASDTSHSPTVAAGDLLAVKVVVSGGGATAQHRICWQLTN